jgi:transaldolase
MGLYTYPKFPTTTNPVDFIIELIEWIIGVPLIAIANFIRGIAAGITKGSSSSAKLISGFIGRVFSQSVDGFSYAFGPFGIVIASLIWGIAILILVFFIFKAIQLALHETEDD